VVKQYGHGLVLPQSKGWKKMCVWTGFIGNRQCASGLLDALEAIEGVWAGHYTGLVTVDAAGLHYAKCAGCVGEWRKRFNVADVPGCTGLAHSRTPSGGGDNRAHPYMAAHGKVGVVSQGSLRSFSHLQDTYQEIGNTLADGRIFNSSEPTCDKWRFVLKDGQTPSLSDIVSNAIEREYEQTGDPVASMRKIGATILEESSTMVLFHDRPGEIGFINMNQRFVYNFTADGVYLAISTLALPQGYGTEIPGNTVGMFTKDTVTIEQLTAEYHVSPLFPDNLENAVLNYLEENPYVSLSAICNAAIKPLFTGDGLEYHAVASYRTLETLLRNGKVRYVEEESIGSVGQKARVFKYCLA